MAVGTLQPALVALLWLFPGISGVVLTVRIWRKRVDQTLGLDDALIVLAWLLAITHSVISTIYVYATWVGYHDQDVPFPRIDWDYANRIQYGLTVCYIPILCVIKASFMWSLQRLRSRNVWVVRSLWFMQGFNLLYFIGAVVASIIPCVPLAKKFDATLPGSCYDNTTFVVANVIITIITDVLVLVIPTWMIYDLQMALRKKLITIGFLSMGFVVIVIAVLRMQWLVRIFHGQINNYSVETCYSAVESNIAIIGASGPTIKYIFGFIIPGLKSSMQKESSSKNYGGNSTRDQPRQKNSKYGDLDSESLEHTDIELKSDWQWKNKDSDARSDEQRITHAEANEHGIVKTVDWNVSSAGDSMSARRAPGSQDPPSHGRPPVQPVTAL